MKKKILLLLTSMFLVSCAQGGNSSSPTPTPSSDPTPASSDPAPSSDPVVSSSDSGTWTFGKEAPVYMPQLNESAQYAPRDMGTLTYATNSLYGDTQAFVSINSLIKVADYPQTVTVSWANDTLTYTFSGNMGSFSINKKGEWSFSDLRAFSSMGDSQMIELDKTAAAGWHTDIIASESTVTQITKPVTYRLADYDLPFYVTETDAYILSSIAGRFFFYGKLQNFVFNGTNFYFIADVPGTLNRGTADSPFTASYYGTSKNINASTKSEANAFLDGNAFLFSLDMVYGFKDEAAFQNGYGAFLEAYYPQVLEDLFSTDVETVITAYEYIIQTIMGDGHSAIYTDATRGIYGTFYNGGRHLQDVTKTPWSERYTNLILAAQRLKTARAAALGLESMESPLGDNYLEIDGDTAVIRFDEFIGERLAANQSDAYYESHVATDNFSLFYTAYKKIAAAGTVKNVIVDITCNEGGQAEALIANLGFILDKPNFVLYDHASQTAMDATYKTDCDADGSFDDNDSPASKYTHYVMTSSFSFSCGNGYPAFAKMGGVKTIGQQSGGGSCVVLPFITNDGYPCRISGPFELGKTKLSDASIDNGIAPDITIPESDFYDIAKLKEAIAA